ncbi:Aspartate-proton symporter [Pseudoclavibacter triregionum]|nr:Aspartate-proton symporter [Pseudoclavibacter triregionum]
MTESRTRPATTRAQARNSTTTTTTAPEGGRFKRELGRWDVIAVGVGAMIGFGWVVLTGDWIGSAGTAGAALAMLAGGAMMAVVALVYSELVAAMPKAGGEHNYIMRALRTSGGGGGVEAADDQEHSESVVVVVGEAAGDASGQLDESVHGLGAAVG